MADRRLQVFYAVARQKSFNRAAEALFLSQSAVTFQIRQLEDEMNARLLDRKHGPVRLTAAGEIVYSYAERILALGDEMSARLADLTGEMRGSLRIGATSGLGESLLPVLLAEFNGHHPQVRVELGIANSCAVVDGVQGQGFDVGLILAKVPPAGVETESCGEEELRVVCTPDHPLARQKEVGARGLRDFEYLARERGSGSRAAADAFFAAAGVPLESLKTIVEAGSVEALKAVVATGLGYAILPERAVERQVREGSLCALPLKPRQRLTVQLVYPAGRFRSRVVVSFGEFMRRRLPETLP